MEGPNLGLYLSAVTPQVLWAALPLAPRARVLVRNPPHAPRVVAWSELSPLEGDVELIDLPAGHGHLPSLPEPLLSDPATAVPRAWGSRLAAGLYPGGHAVVFSPDAAPLLRFLSVAIAHRVRDVVGGACPTLPSAALARLARPVAPGEWVQVEVTSQSRLWFLDFQRRTASGGVLQDRWVCRRGTGEWRTGWFW